MREQHEADLRGGRGRAPLPYALARKYPNADREWGWQWVFPAASHYLDRRTGIERRHHLHESVVQKELSETVVESLPVLASPVLRLEAIPLHHRDPFDRLLIAKARWKVWPS